MENFDFKKIAAYAFLRLPLSLVLIWLSLTVAARLWDQPVGFMEVIMSVPITLGWIIAIVLFIVGWASLYPGMTLTLLRNMVDMTEGLSELNDRNSTPQDTSEPSIVVPTESEQVEILSDVLARQTREELGVKKLP